LLAENPADLPLIRDLIARYLRNAWQFGQGADEAPSPTNKKRPHRREQRQWSRDVG